MSSAAFAQARAFSRKAGELNEKGHLLRAAEIFGRAAEAARALHSGPDSLIVADSQRCQAHTLLSYALSVDNSTAEARSAVASHRAESVVLLSAAVAALERRRMADTLLEGKCTATEEAWFAAKLQGTGDSADEVAWQAKLLGYYSFLGTAYSTMFLFVNAFLFEGACSAAQFEAFAQCVVHATDLLQLPRSHGTQPIGAELLFLETLSPAVADESGVPRLQTRGVDPRLVQLLTDAWQRLQQSGVLQARGLLNEGLRQFVSAHNEHSVAVNRAALSAPGLRSCALAGCGAKEAHPQHFKRCSACRTVVYCSKEHQLEAWPAHKAACKAARKAAAAASSEGGEAGPSAA